MNPNEKTGLILPPGVKTSDTPTPREQPKPMSKNHEDGIYYGQAGYIETFSGQHFYLHDPIFHVEDIAHGLALCCRYNGQCSDFYSVAEHSVLVAYLMDKHIGGDPFEGIMHDALEAYLSDVPAPLKQFLPDYKKLDKELDEKLRETFNLPATKTAECREADWLALFIEAYYLMPSKGETFADPNNLRPRALSIIENENLVAAMPPEIAEAFWLKSFDSFTEGVRVAGGTAH